MFCPKKFSSSHVFGSPKFGRINFAEIVTKVIKIFIIFLIIIFIKKNKDSN